MWIVILAVVAFLVIMLLNGMVHQEHYLLWKEYQVELAEKKKLEVEHRKREAASRIKQMLRDGRRRAESGSADMAAAGGAAIPAGRPHPAPEPASVG